MKHLTLNQYAFHVQIQLHKLTVYSDTVTFFFSFKNISHLLFCPSSQDYDRFVLSWKGSTSTLVGLNDRLCRIKKRQININKQVVKEWLTSTIVCYNFRDGWWMFFIWRLRVRKKTEIKTHSVCLYICCNLSWCVRETFIPANLVSCF